MGRFVNPKAEFSITDGTDIIWVIAKMSLDVREAVGQDLLRLKMSKGKKGRGGKSQDSMEGTFSVEAQKKMLLVHNIKRWEGPGFMKEDKNGRMVPVVCNRASISLLDITDPLIDEVLNELNRRNTPRSEMPDEDGEAIASDPKEQVIFEVSENGGTSPSRVTSPQKSLAGNSI